jgi:LmbE family N-acetylglucosaminyl deacetylase
MERREFLGGTLSATLLGSDSARKPPATAGGTSTTDAETIGGGPAPEIERAQSGRPHAGKVLATIAPHSDDHSILCGGTVAKLIGEGYTGYLIRTSNDEMDSYDLSVGATIAANESDNERMAKVLGIKQVFDMNYRNHALDDVPKGELRARLIFLIRLLKIDTIFSYDPWGHYEENPDHYITAQAIEAACWMAAGHNDFPEHMAAGLRPHAVREKYYYARGPQLVNRIVDITAQMDQKMDAICANRTMLGHMVGEFREELAARKLKLPELEGDQEAAIRAYADLRFRPLFAGVGEPYGLEYAERFHYIGPSTALEGYIKEHAVPL